MKSKSGRRTKPMTIRFVEDGCLHDCTGDNEQQVKAGDEFMQVRVFSRRPVKVKGVSHLIEVADLIFPNGAMCQKVPWSEFVIVE